MTRGIDDPENYYYRRVFTDAVRAVEAARSHPLTDASRTVAVGGSQGGGITIAVGGLVPDLAARRARRAVPVRLPARGDADGPSPVPGDRPVTSRRTAAARADVLRTLSYFDGVHFAAARHGARRCSRRRWRTRPARPPRCSPPSTPGRTRTRTIEVYDFNDHEGGGPYQEAAKLRWLRSYA